MLTWTTYGTWLQGDKRRYVKKGTILPPNENLLKANKTSQAYKTVRLSTPQRNLVRTAIIQQAKVINQRLLAVVVCSNHIHLVGGYIHQPLEKVVACYKKAARLALKDEGHTGRLWTKGYDKRFCFDENSLERRINYVQNHNPA